MRINRSNFGGQSVAFTLIELLVVISIIALLVGILLPALGAARHTAQRSVCLSNSRQIAVVMQMYADDDKDSFFPTAEMQSHSHAHGAVESWIHLTEPYLEAQDVYVCPSDDSENWDEPMPMNQRVTSYGINAYFTPNHPPYHGLMPSEIVNPSKAVIAAEIIEDVTMDHFMPMFFGSPPHVANMMMQTAQWEATASVPKTLAFKRHTTTANYVFTDGHAASHAFTDTWQQINGARPTIDYYDPKR